MDSSRSMWEVVNITTATGHTLHAWVHASNPPLMSTPTSSFPHFSCVPLPFLSVVFSQSLATLASTVASSSATTADSVSATASVLDPAAVAAGAAGAGAPVVGVPSSGAYKNTLSPRALFTSVGVQPGICITCGSHESKACNQSKITMPETPIKAKATPRPTHHTHGTAPPKRHNTKTDEGRCRARVCVWRRVRTENTEATMRHPARRALFSFGNARLMPVGVR